MKRWFLLFPLLTAIALAQAAAPAKPAAPASPAPSAAVAKPADAATPALPAGVTDTITAYLLPDDLKLKIRDAQLEWDELEIDSQKALVKVEQNKERQKELSDAIRVLAYQFTQTKQIDLQAWELDAKTLKFVKRKAAAK
jgi:hypothetical protein